MGLFNWANMKPMKEGKGVDEVKEPPLTVYFGVIGRKFWKFVTLNLIYFMTGLPTWLFMGLCAQCLICFHSGHDHYNLYIPYIAMLIPLIALISGPAQTGASYVLRQFAKEKHAWVASDMFEKASKNYLQSALVGLINSALAFVLLYMYFYYGTLTPGKLHFMNYIIILLAFLLVAMRCYIYPMLVSYKLKLKDLYRYSLALVIMKFPQNLLLQIFSFGVIVAAFWYPRFGIIASGLIGVSLMAFTKIFYTSRVLLENMDEKNEKIYPEKDKRK